MNGRAEWTQVFDPRLPKWSSVSCHSEFFLSSLKQKWAPGTRLGSGKIQLWEKVENLLFPFCTLAPLGLLPPSPSSFLLLDPQEQEGTKKHLQKTKSSKKHLQKSSPSSVNNLKIKYLLYMFGKGMEIEDNESLVNFQQFCREWKR